jgi:hypothetical protein
VHELWETNIGMAHALRSTMDHSAGVQIPDYLKVVFLVRPCDKHTEVIPVTTIQQVTEKMIIRRTQREKESPSPTRSCRS